jgi:ribonuclease D
MIQRDTELHEIIERIKSAPWVAIDTEADSLHAYPEKICLIQISLPGHDDLIDPLSGNCIEPFLKSLSGHELIMHGSDYDLRLFRKHYNFVPSAVFDTMLAARLTGLSQFGLTNLVEQFLGVRLDKGPQKADWAMRPLTERMEAYARNDTHYLKDLSDRLKTTLESKGRMAWLKECCARLVAECSELRLPDPDSVWRIKGSNKLTPPALAVLRELWRWRESEAITSNKPPYFILSHETLIDIAESASCGKPYEGMLPHRMSERRRDSIRKAVVEGLSIPPHKYPKPLRHSNRRLTESEKKKIEELQKHRDARAKELEIDPTLIASRAALVDLALNPETALDGMMKWQRDLMA